MTKVVTTPSPFVKYRGCQTTLFGVKKGKISDLSLYIDEDFVRFMLTFTKEVESRK